jgi:hypothetical protein
VSAEETCIICDSIMHDWEMTEHFRLCLLIQGKRTGRTDSEITSELAKVVDAQGERGRYSSLREQSGWGSAWPSVPEDPEHPGEQRQPIPRGKHRCASCNGLKALYPDCPACGGVGWR